MSDITAASSLSTMLRQTATHVSHNAYDAARSGQAPDKVNLTSASSFSADGSLMHADRGVKGSSPLSQVLNFLA